MSGQPGGAIKRTRRAALRAGGLLCVRDVQARLDRMIERKDELESALAKPLTEHWMLVLVLAYAGSLSSRDLASTVLAFEPSPLFERFERLRHRPAAYRLLYDLAKRRLLKRAKRDGVLVFQLPRRVRSEIRRVLGPPESRAGDERERGQTASGERSPR